MAFACQFQWDAEDNVSFPLFPASVLNSLITKIIFNIIAYRVYKSISILKLLIFYIIF